jgi:hypothetical protein
MSSSGVAEPIGCELLNAVVRPLRSFMVKHLAFLALVGGYFAVVHLCGMPLLSRRLGFELAFVGGAWVACYWEGPATRRSLPSTSFRPEAILTGGGLMILALALKLARRFN